MAKKVTFTKKDGEFLESDTPFIKEEVYSQYRAIREYIKILKSHGGDIIIDEVSDSMKCKGFSYIVYYFGKNNNSLPYATVAFITDKVNLSYFIGKAIDIKKYTAFSRCKKKDLEITILLNNGFIDSFELRNVLEDDDIVVNSLTFMRKKSKYYDAAKDAASLVLNMIEALPSDYHILNAEEKERISDKKLSIISIGGYTCPLAQELFSKIKEGDEIVLTTKKPLLSNEVAFDDNAIVVPFILTHKHAKGGITSVKIINTLQLK